jgi:hypothetical protein
VRWDRFFEDMEDQLDSEWEAERAALDTEAERLRLSRVALRDRLVALTRDARDHVVHLADGDTATGRIARVGADWFALVAGGAPAGGATIVPLWAVVGIGAPADAILASVRDAESGRRTLTGTVDRAGADHLDLALHDPGAPRRAENVTGYRIVPFAAVAAVRLASAADLG